MLSTYQKIQINSTIILKVTYLYSMPLCRTVSTHVTEHNLTKENKEGGRTAEEGRECMQERKDECDVLQQRTVTNQAVI